MLVVLLFFAFAVGSSSGVLSSPRSLPLIITQRTGDRLDTVLFRRFDNLMMNYNRLLWSRAGCCGRLSVRVDNVGHSDGGDLIVSREYPWVG